MWRGKTAPLQAWFLNSCLNLKLLVLPHWCRGGNKNWMCTFFSVNMHQCVTSLGRNSLRGLRQRMKSTAERLTACSGSHSGAFSPQNGIKISILCLIYSCWLFVCARANYWPPVKTVPTHLRGPKWALSGWHRAGHMSLLLWRRILPVFCCHLLPVSGQTARRGRVSRLVLEIKGRWAVFTSHLTDTPRCLHIARYRPFFEDSERHLSSSQLLSRHVFRT